MSQSSVLASVPRPGPGRITLALLAVVPAVMAALSHPSQSTRAYWLIGIAVVVVILLFGWSRGLYFTTMLRRRLAIAGRAQSRASRAAEPGANTRSTALLRIGAAPSDAQPLPLPLIAGYLDCYGIRADHIRITNRNNATGQVETWIGLTVSAVDNLAALQARSAQIPLHQTAEVAGRRLADHLREIGWDAATVSSDDVPELLDFQTQKASRETWRSVQQGDSDYVAGYRVNADDDLPGTLTQVRSQSAREIWTALEIAQAAPGGLYTVTAACALRTDAAPSSAAPVAGLTLERGNQRPVLTALDPLSTQRLPGHTEAPADLLSRLDWPTPPSGAHRVPASEAATQVISV